jgi:WD40 repeat protein
VTRRSNLAMDLYSILVGAFLGLAVNYVSNNSNGLPKVVQEIIRKWSIILAGALLFLLILGRLWQHRIEKPISVARAWDRTKSPYPGLESFTEEDAAAFFGRDREIRLLIDRLKLKTDRKSRQCVPVVGPSGSGKSSLVQAGLLPQLATKSGKWVIIPTIVPGSKPISNMARSIVASGVNSPFAEVARQLVEDTASLSEFLEEQRTKSKHRSPAILLVVDQAEELVTVSTDADRKQFLALIEGALQSCPWLWIILVFRPEFLSQFLREDNAQLFEQPVTIGPLSAQALYDVIERPAVQAGVKFEPPTLISRMVAETRTGEALPLLAWTLSELWDRLNKGSVITEADYDEIGGVGGALISRANSVAGSLVQSGHSYETILNTLLRFFFLRGAAFTRRRLLRGSLNDEEWGVVRTFVEARLLTTDVEDGTGEMVIQVAHEALIEYWLPLKHLAESRMAEMESIVRLEQWAKEWIENDRADEYLLSGGRLRTALLWANAAGTEVAELPHVQEFLDRSTRADQVTARRLADSTAQQALEWVAREPELAIMATVAAEREYASTGMTRQVLIAGISATRLRGVLRLGDTPVLSLDWFKAGKLAIGMTDGSVIILDPEASLDTKIVLTGRGEAVYSVAWSPDGTSLATASEDRTVRIWDLASRNVRVELTGHAGAVYSVAWSPDGTSLATASEDRTVRIWDLASRNVRVELTGHEGGVTSVAWSPDGDTLASGSQDWMVGIWDVHEPARNEMLIAHGGAIADVSWAPDGGRLASCAADHSVRLWSVQPYSPFVTQGGHDKEVTSTTWSPDGTRVASGSRDGCVRFWSGSPTLLHHDRLTRAVAWDPAGKRLATAAFDGTVKVWDGTSGEELCCFRGHEAEAIHLAWAPSSGVLVSTSRDQTIRVWDADTKTSVQVLRGHGGQGTWVAWHPDGTRFATASRDCTVRIWQLDHLSEIGTLTYDVGVTWVSWSPDVKFMAVALLDNTVRIVNLLEKQPDIVLRGHTGEIWGAAWSPDGARVATAAFDGTIRLWDSMSGSLVKAIEGDEDAVLAIAWSASHPTWLASTSRDQAIRLWDIEEGRLVTTLRGHKEAIWGMAWSPDGARLATSADDGEIRIWDIAPNEESALADARSLGLRPLSEQERRRFLLPAIRVMSSNTRSATPQSTSS